MIIRVEPKDFFMSTIFLIFTQGQPDPEDAEVKRFRFLTASLCLAQTLVLAYVITTTTNTERPEKP